MCIMPHWYFIFTEALRVRHHEFSFSSSMVVKYAEYSFLRVCVCVCSWLTQCDCEEAGSSVCYLLIPPLSPYQQY